MTDIQITEADREAAAEIIRCLDPDLNDHAYDELLLIIKGHRRAATEYAASLVEQRAADFGISERVWPREAFASLATAIRALTNKPHSQEG